MHSSKGVYAFLLGSGVSRAAEIPTGWEVVLDLIRKLAHLKNEDCDPNPARWYREQFDKEPDYSEILNHLAQSPEEQSQLLKSYFEPTEEERERGAKLPSKAHCTIARLVANGTVRVIVTTNFDRLIEKALGEVGISPTVIALPNAAEGALPLAHSDCTIIKLHGDYLDTRTKNTTLELASYDERIDRLLDQVFDEYGLVVCGWSGVWDKALISAFERCESRRFSIYWTAYQGETSEQAERLINLRGAEVIPIDGADAFFSTLGEKIEALREYDRPHPLSAKLAVSSLKRYLPDPRHQIALHDLVMDETERVCQIISGEQFSPSESYDPDTLVKRVSRYESTLDVLTALFVHGCYWGEKEHRAVWEISLQRIANTPSQQSRQVWSKLQLYPALLLFYAGGIAAVSHDDKYANLLSLFNNPRLRLPINAGQHFSPLYLLRAGYVIKKNVSQHLSDAPRPTALNEHLFEVLATHCVLFYLPMRNTSAALTSSSTCAFYSTSIPTMMIWNVFMDL